MANRNLQLSINFDQEILLSEIIIPSLGSSNSDSKAYVGLEEREDIACHFFDDFEQELKPSNQGSMLEVQSYRFGDSGMDLEQEIQEQPLGPKEDAPLEESEPLNKYFTFDEEGKNSESPKTEFKGQKKINPSKKEAKTSKKRRMITQKIQEIFKHKTQRRKKVAIQIVKP